MKIITDERCIQYSAPGHPERPARISKTLGKLRSQTDLTIDWAEPLPVSEETLLRAHSPEHLASLQNTSDAFDPDTPAYPEIFQHASRAVGGGLQALAAARSGEPVFSLLRPPGHHATRDRAMGFCYLSTIAITTLEALATGAGRVAVLDFDVHHGNGTEAILLNYPGTAFYSIHQYPCYPGTGKDNIGDNCFNYPVAPRAPRDQYRNILARALEDLQRFQPKMIAVSAGFDAYARDFIASGTLEVEDFYWLGQSLRKMEIPFFSILEGGYSSELPELILAYLKGVEGK